MDLRGDPFNRNFALTLPGERNFRKGPRGKSKNRNDQFSHSTQSPATSRPLSTTGRPPLDGLNSEPSKASGGTEPQVSRLPFDGVAGRLMSRAVMLLQPRPAGAEDTRETSANGSLRPEAAGACLGLIRQRHLLCQGEPQRLCRVPALI